jgi:hypothetical protein
MKWTFQREAQWMMWLALFPVALIALALLWPALRRALG